MPRFENKDLLESSRPEVKDHDLHTTKRCRRNNVHQHRLSISTRLGDSAIRYVPCSHECLTYERHDMCYHLTLWSRNPDFQVSPFPNSDYIRSSAQPIGLRSLPQQQLHIHLVLISTRNHVISHLLASVALQVTIQ